MSDLADPTRPAPPVSSAALAVPAPISERPRAKRHWSLAWKLTLAFAATFAALEAALLISSHVYWRRVLQSHIRAHLTEVAASRRDAVETGVKLLKQQASFNAQRADFRRFLATTPGTEPAEADRVNSQKRLEQLVDQHTLSANLLDLNGRIVLSSAPEKVGRSIKTDHSFKYGISEPFVGSPALSGTRFTMNISAPVGSAKNPVGVLMMTVSPEPIAAPLRDTAGLGQTGEVLLLVRDGDQLRYVLPPQRPDAATPVAASSAPALASLVGASGSFLEMPDYRGRPVLAASSHTGYRDWTVVAKTDSAEAYAPIAQALRTGLLYGALVAAAGTLAVHGIARRITRPLRRVSEAAARIAKGDLSADVPVTSHDEFGLLSNSFNEMTQAIRARVAERNTAEAALREADQRKDNFLAILGHELRNPVGAIAAGMRMLKETSGEEANPTGVREVIERQTGNLTRLVDDLLDVARISTGRIELRRAPVRVQDLISHAVETVKSAIEARHHRVKIELLEGSPLWANVDATRIEQVLANLLSNAAKYTQNGGRISITERLENDEAVIVVCDNGIGMTPESLSKIFKLFTQVESSLHQRAGGLGVGLSLSRQLVELHGGELSAYSPGRGCGSEFTIRLPAIEAPAARASELAAPAPAPAGHRRILLVDDNEDTARLLSGLLARRGHEVCVAYDAVTALEAAQSFAPEVFLLDIGLPDIDGYELARRFRAEGARHHRFIAISGYAQEGDRASAHDAGFDFHLAKPVDIDELNALILA